MELREELKKTSSQKILFLLHHIQHLQIGRIKGGLARNVIADQCVVDWELRPVIKEDGEFLSIKLMDDYM